MEADLRRTSEGRTTLSNGKRRPRCCSVRPVLRTFKLIPKSCLLIINWKGKRHQTWPNLKRGVTVACVQIRTATSDSRFLSTIMSKERPSKNSRVNNFSQTLKSKISSLLRPSRSSTSSLIDPGSSSDHHQTVAMTDGDKETR